MSRFGAVLPTRRLSTVSNSPAMGGFCYPEVWEALTISNWKLFLCCLISQTGDDGRVFVFELDNGRTTVCELSSLQGPVTHLRWVSYPKWSGNLFFITAGHRGTLKLWKKEAKEASLHPLSSKPLLTRIGSEFSVVWSRSPSWSIP